MAPFGTRQQSSEKHSLIKRQEDDQSLVSIHKIGFLRYFTSFERKGVVPSYRKRLVLKDVCLIMSVLGFCVES